MSHFRRPFYDLYEAHKSAAAKEALERITALYVIENEIRGIGRTAQIVDTGPDIAFEFDLPAGLIWRFLARRCPQRLPRDWEEIKISTPSLGTPIVQTHFHYDTQSNWEFERVSITFSDRVASIFAMSAYVPRVRHHPSHR